VGCSDLLAGPHEQGIGVIGIMGIGPDAPYGPYAPSHKRSSNCLDTGRAASTAKTGPK
jgi:hypothetical protein